jgi:hypothetical protein
LSSLIWTAEVGFGGFLCPQYMCGRERQEAEPGEPDLRSTPPVRLDFGHNRLAPYTEKSTLLPARNTVPRLRIPTVPSGIG